MPRDYPEYEDESPEETYRDPLKPFLIALVVLLLLFAAIIVLLYMRLQTANTRAETLSQELTAVQVQLDDLRAQRAAETPTPTPTEAPTPTPEPTPEPTATPEPTPEVTATVKLLESVPLDAETQAAILELCGGDRDTFCAIMAIAWVESRFDTDAVGDNGVSIGMMQVNTRWHTGRMEALGVTDLTDPVQCAAVALDYLRELSEGYGFGWITDHDLYMAYNMGPGNARIAIDSGTASSGYSSAALTAYGDYTLEMEATQE